MARVATRRALLSRPAAGGAWWEVAGQTCVAAYQAIGAASLEASYVNLANPGTYDLTTTAAPSWDASTGWTFDGATTFLNTGYTPSVTQARALIVRYTKTGTGRRAVMGGGNPDGPRFAVFASYYYSDRPHYANTSIGSGASGSTSGGVLAVSGSVGYLNGAVDKTGIEFSAKSVAAVQLGCNMWHATREHYLTGTIAAAALYSGDVGETAIAALSAAMAALS